MSLTQDVVDDVVDLGPDVDVVGAVDTLQLLGVEDGDDLFLSGLGGLQPQGGQEGPFALHVSGNGTRKEKTNQIQTSKQTNNPCQTKQTATAQKVNSRQERHNYRFLLLSCV